MKPRCKECDAQRQARARAVDALFRIYRTLIEHGEPSNVLRAEIVDILTANGKA